MPKPVLREDLVRVLSMLASISPENEVSQSKIITVYSNKGGIGKTTIAVNLAAELAKVTKDKVALVAAEGFEPPARRYFNFLKS